VIEHLDNYFFKFEFVTVTIKTSKVKLYRTDVSKMCNRNIAQFTYKDLLGLGN